MDNLTVGILKIEFVCHAGLAAGDVRNYICGVVATITGSQVGMSA